MSEKMKITNLNIDCLESVFEYLEFSDLLSVASSNKRLNKAANFVYVREHSNKRVYFENIQLLQRRSFRIYDHFISIYDVRTSLQFIRCFGNLVSKVVLILSMQETHEHYQHVINYINEYCSDSLTSNPTSKEWEHLKKPFSKVEEVCWYKFDIDDKNFFNRLFPKMKSLKAYFYKDAKAFFANANHFSNLEQLYILDRGYSYSMLCGETMAPVLHLNPQLVRLEIYSRHPPFDSSYFQSAIKALQNLETLSFDVQTLSTNSIDRVICLNSVKSFTIHINSKSYFMKKIPFLFGQLGALTMSFKGELPAEFFKFIDKHPTIKELKLYVESLSVADQSKIMKSLPLLHSISFRSCKISANEAKHFMSNFENLKQFSFDIDDITANNDFQARLSNEWECKCEIIGSCRKYYVNRKDP